MPGRRMPERAVRVKTLTATLALGIDDSTSGGVEDRRALCIDPRGDGERGHEGGARVVDAAAPRARDRARVRERPRRRFPFRRLARHSEEPAHPEPRQHPEFLRRPGQLERVARESPGAPASPGELRAQLRRLWRAAVELPPAESPAPLVRGGARLPDRPRSLLARRRGAAGRGGCGPRGGSPSAQHVRRRLHHRTLGRHGRGVLPRRLRRRGARPTGGGGRVLRAGAADEGDRLHLAPRTARLPAPRARGRRTAAGAPSHRVARRARRRGARLPRDPPAAVRRGGDARERRRIVAVLHDRVVGLPLLPPPLPLAERAGRRPPRLSGGAAPAPAGAAS